MVSADEPVLTFHTGDDWEAWLERHHETSGPVWLRLARKGVTPATVGYVEAVEVALCFGWIDSQKAASTGGYSVQRFSRRRARSPWSAINRERAVALAAAGRMRPAGIVAVDAAKADGRWDAAYAGSRTATVPDDLAAALAAVPEARQAFDELDKANRYAILYRLMAAKRPETRARRITTFVDMLARGDVLHPTSARRPAKPQGT
ncbi:MAG: bacteriocin-protection protein [Actinomycetota bacterium]|nr:MAG: bacteriocin-protection protein [Actinomycetota bacterium]